MSDPIDKFKQIFFEESADAVDKVDQYLLSLSPEEFDNDIINDIFRAAHSLKGGSATFGMKTLAEFTHFMETLLDQLRDGEKQFSQEIIDCLLDCLDCVRTLLDHYQTGTQIDEEKINSVTKVLSRLIDGADNTVAHEQDPQALQINDDTACQWNIVFIPDGKILMTGNEPLRFIEEIAELGELEVICDIEQIPTLDTFSPTDIYMKWNLILSTPEAIDKELINDVFIWIEDEAEIHISSIQDSQLEALYDDQPALVEQKPTEQAELGAGTVLPIVSQVSEKPEQAPPKTAVKQSIRVDLDKIDGIINILGELVITQSMLSTFNDIARYPELQFLQKGLNELEKHTRDLQDGIMQIRMLPIDASFNRFPRLVRDLSKQLNKDIKVVIDGGGTEVDKTVIEELSDPLVHLARNSIDHGIELPHEREAAGKPAQGTLTFKAFHRVGNIVIEIGDDGRGLQKDKLRQKAIEKGLIKPDEYLSDDAINEIIFRPGFSTATEITDVSGRGVGMDVVRQNIRSLGGGIEVESTEGVGTKFKIRLPLTLSILDGQLIKIANETYVLPMLAIIESIKIKQSDLNIVSGKEVSLKWRDKFIPLLNLALLFECPQACEMSNDMNASVLIVVVEHDGVHVGIIVDELANHQQVVVKSLEANYQKIDAISGATILGDGSVSLIIDVGALTELARRISQ